MANILPALTYLLICILHAFKIIHIIFFTVVVVFLVFDYSIMILQFIIKVSLLYIDITWCFAWIENSFHGYGIKWHHIFLDNHFCTIEKTVHLLSYIRKIAQKYLSTIQICTFDLRKKIFSQLLIYFAIEASETKQDFCSQKKGKFFCQITGFIYIII